MQFSERAWRYRLYLLLRGRRFYKDYAKLIDDMAYGDPLSISARHLARLLAFVQEYNKYYSGLLPRDCGLRSLPILTKEIARRHFEDLQSVPQGAVTYRNSSGGSTGRPVTLIQDANYASWLNATQGYYFREFLGVEMNTVKNIWLWGSERDSLRIRDRRIRSRVASFLSNKVFLNTFDVDEQRWLEYIEIVRRYRPHYIAGYAGSLYQMARVARRHNIRLYQPSFVYSSAEMLRGFMRSEIEEQFNTKVYDYYGSREVGAIAGECVNGNSHVFAMNNLVEVIDDNDQPVTDGSEGRLIITNLHNYSFPMIRYEIGDTGALHSRSCECGSKLPVLKQLSGRITDHFVLANGKLVHGEFITHLFYFREWVDQFQVDQLEHDKLRIRIVCRNAVNENDVRDIANNLRFVMGENCKLEWEYVGSIDRSPQGKFLFTRCLIGNDVPRES